MRNLVALIALALLMAGCGKSLDEPEAITLREFAAGPVALSFVMTACSDSCSTYDEGSCSLDRDGTTIKANVSIGFSQRDGVDANTLDGCSLRCGGPVLVHCSPINLEVGTYTVEAAGGFTETIFVK